MAYIELKAEGVPTIRFRLYEDRAPATCKAFLNKLPISAKAVQARFAGEEIWIKDGPVIDIPQENSTINPEIGELGYAPDDPKNEVARSIAIIYGEAKLSGNVNIFARVYDEDLIELKKLGEKIWLEGARILEIKLVNN